jgi:class 3 adenylate cyclase
MSEVLQWLDALGLGQYAGAFKDNAIEWRHLCDLDGDALKELGVNALGHRMTLLRALKSLDVPSVPLATASGQTVIESPPASDAERKQLTVLFADLAGSTELSRQIDAEALSDVTRAYQDAAKVAIERFDGYVARYMGDGVLAYFGYPVAHEDDPEWAARAGLALAMFPFSHDDTAAPGDSAASAKCTVAGDRLHGRQHS